MLYNGRMKYINVRQLLSNFEESTSDLPAVVTRFGQPIFQILPIVDSAVLQEKRTRFGDTVVIKERVDDLKASETNVSELSIMEKEALKTIEKPGKAHKFVDKCNWFVFKFGTRYDCDKPVFKDGKCKEHAEN
jgi:hypothetical protein